jgi:hypothetical protein
VIVPHAAVAQTIESAYRFLDTRQSISVFGGHLETNRGALELGPRPGAIFGLRYDLGVGGPFVVEAELGWFSSTRAVQDTVPADTTRMTVGDVDFRGLTASVALRFDVTGARTWHGLLPYILFGGGFTTDMAAESDIETALPADVRFKYGSRFTGVIGGGVEWLSASQVGVRFDVRNLLWKLKAPGAFLFGDRALALPSSQWTQNVAFTAGLTLRF